MQLPFDVDHGSPVLEDKVNEEVKMEEFCAFKLNAPPRSNNPMSPSRLGSHPVERVLG